MTHPEPTPPPQDTPGGRWLRAVGDTDTPPAAPVTTGGRGPGSADTASAEAAAAADVARSRRDLPAVDPVVFDCFLGDLVRAVEADTEADPIAILASLVCAAGVHLGQRPHIRAGDDVHPLLVWPLIVGRTNSGRKGASWATAKRLLIAADAEFVTTNVRSGLTSGEGLAAMFAEPDDEHDPDAPPRAAQRTPPARGALLPPGDRRLLVFEPEWAAVMARMKREGNSLSATLRAAWEGGDLSTLNVTARVAPSSHIGLLAHITPDEFRAKVSAADLAGGTYNRFLPVAAARSKFLPLSVGADPELVAELGATLTDRLALASGLDTIGFTDQAATLWRALYVEFGADTGDHGPVEQFISRTAPNCLRIAAIHAALDGTSRIEPQHLTAAAALVRYSVASARAVFTDNQQLNRLAAWIADAGPQGRTREEVRSDFFGRHRTADQITGLLDQLVTAGRITATKRARADGRAGRGKEVYVATEPLRG